MTDSPPSLPPLAERWDPERTERTLAGLHQKKRTRRRVRGVAVLLVLGLIGWSLWPAPVQVVERAVGSPLQLALADGSHVLRRDETTQVAVSESSATQVTLELTGGQARFDVARNEQRVFRVRSGEVTVEVLGTSFEVERDGARTRVAVLHGRVAVSFHAHHTELSAGEAGWFPREEWLPREEALPHEEGVPHEEGAAREGPAGERTRSASRTRSVAARSWREPAEQGEFERAYELLAQTRKPVADDVEELMLAADTARLSGHAAAAVPYLRRVMNEHAKDSRASLAAFTLGGVLMQQLGQPREAEAAYARARALSLNSSLAEDALARQVEAAHRAGDAALARSLAREYVAQYPSGRRVRAVRRFGELEP